jgi:hypothetical protein
MIGRNKRGNRQANMKARLGIATAVLVGGSAVGVAAVAAASHGPATNTAKSAGFTLNFHHAVSEQVALSSALSTWGSSQQKSLNTLTRMQSMPTFTQTWQHRTEFAAQRGVVVLATKKFLLVKSKNGALHLWWIKPGVTQFKDVSTTMTGWTALTGSSWAANAAMVSNNMTPASTVVAGSTTVVSQLTAPVTRTTSVTVDTGSAVVKVTITSTTATVTQTTTTSVVTPTTTRQWNWTATQGVRRGDLVFVAGWRVHGQLIAKLVLFAAPTDAPTFTPSSTATSTLPGTPTPTSTSTFTGSHS